MPRRLLHALALCTLCSAPALAVRPIRPPAPEFPEGNAWVNSVALSLPKLRGRRVVLVSFMDLSTPNSVRTLPVLKRWWDLYALEGLMVVGVHTPDYSFERDPLEVRQSIKRFDIKFPITIDTRRTLWKAYSNEGWPAHYLIDHKGRIVHDRVGEGGYTEFEEEILLALNRLNGYRPPKGARPQADPLKTNCLLPTPGRYMGTARGKAPKKIDPTLDLPVGISRNGEVSFFGAWSNEPESLRYTGTKADMKSPVRVIYTAAEALAVLGSSGPRPVRVYVQQNGAWLHAGNANVDIKWDDDDQSYLLVDKPRLYYLTKNKADDLNTLALMPLDTGLDVYALDFSDFCQTDYEHR
ncbi:MAG: redoxin family protein [Elusimicrobiota bacterium]